MSGNMRLVASLHLGPGMAKQIVRDHYLNAFREIEKEQIEIMQQEIMKSGKGKAQWRSEFAGKVGRVWEIVTDDLIEYGVAPVLSGGLFEYVRLMVITAGVVSDNHTGPEGRQVFNDPLDAKVSSRAKTQRKMPTPDGYDWLSNSMKRMEAKFRAAIETAWATLPQDAFVSAVSVVGR